MQIAPTHLAGDLLCLLAGILYTVYFATMAKARDTMAPIPALALSTLASVLPLLIFANVLGEQVMPHNWTPLVLMALSSQIIGQGLMIFALGQMAATIGWVWYGERLDGVDMIGAVAVAVALVLVRGERKDAAELAPEGVENA
jgi:drug/metabolite transporter (DMT)-like permease